MSADPAQLKMTRDFGQPGILFDLALIPDSGRIVYGSSDFQLYEFDTAAEKPEPVQFDGAGHQSYVTCVLHVGGQIVSGSYDGQLTSKLFTYTLVEKIGVIGRGPEELPISAVI